MMFLFFEKNFKNCFEFPNFVVVFFFYFIVWFTCMLVLLMPTDNAFCVFDIVVAMFGCFFAHAPLTKNLFLGGVHIGNIFSYARLSVYTENTMIMKSWL